MLKPFRYAYFLILIVAFLGLSACREPSHELIDISIDDITSISLARFGDQLVLEKHDGQWEVVVPVKTRANPVTIENLLMTLDKLTVEETVSKSPVDHGQYGVDNNGFKLSLRSANASQEIVVGRAGKDFDTQHIRVDDGNEVFLARGRINTVMRVDIWRYRIILDIDLDDIESATFTAPDISSRLFRQDSTWVLNDDDGDHSVLTSRVEEWAGFFHPLNTDRFADVSRDVVTENAQRKVVFEMKDGSEHVLEFLDFQGEWGIGIDDDNVVYQIFGLRLDNMFPDLLPFYDPIL